MDYDGNSFICNSKDYVTYHKHSMEFFTPDLYQKYNTLEENQLSEIELQWETRIQAYRQEYDTFKPDLPKGLREWTENVFPHDAVIESFHGYQSIVCLGGDVDSCKKTTFEMLITSTWKPRHTYRLTWVVQGKINFDRQALHNDVQTGCCSWLYEEIKALPYMKWEAPIATECKIRGTSPPPGWFGSMLLPESKKYKLFLMKIFTSDGMVIEIPFSDFNYVVEKRESQPIIVNPVKEVINVSNISENDLTIGFDLCGEPVKLKELSVRVIIPLDKLKDEEKEELVCLRVGDKGGKYIEFDGKWQEIDKSDAVKAVKSKSEMGLAISKSELHIVKTVLANVGME